MRNFIVFYLNGKRHEVSNEWVFKPFADYLRYSQTLTGTKIVCAEGDCGACTILRAPTYLSSKPEFEAINSCIALVSQMDACHVVSIEGLSEKGELTCSQKAMQVCHGSQCGYCTPGFVMALEGLLEKQKKFDQKTAQNHLTGNLCRCTGYQPILEASLEAQKLRDQKRPSSLASRYITTKTTTELRNAALAPVSIKCGKQIYFSPTTLKSLQTFRKKRPRSLIYGAGTDLGVQLNKGKRDLTEIVSLQLIQDFHKIKILKDEISIGAQVTLSELRKVLKNESPALENLLDLFASPQIKNMATLAGNVANASPIADTPPFLLALNAQVEVLTKKGKKRIPISDFYLGYRKTKLAPGDVITAIHFENLKKDEHLKFFKSSQRKDLDISCVNSSLWLKLDSRKQILDLRLAYGGVAATPLRMKKTEKLLVGKYLETLNFGEIATSLQSEIQPLSDLRGTSQYRRLLVENILRKMIHDIRST